MFLVTVLLVLLPITQAQSPQPSACPVVLQSQRQVSARTVGGQVTRNSDRLFQASLHAPPQQGSSTFRCSATRLSKRWLLTAAHCDISIRWFARLSGSTVHNGKRARIERVFRHPKFRNTGAADPFDVALVRIAPPPSEPARVPIVRLNNASWLPLTSAFVRGSGYGIFDYNGSTEPFFEDPIYGELRSVDIPIYPFEPCRGAYYWLQNVPEADKHICTGYFKNRCNNCKGDSGGPLLQYDANARAVQVATIIAGYGCTINAYPGISVRVSAMLPWFISVGAEFETAVPRQVFRKWVTEQFEAFWPTRTPTPSPTSSINTTEPDDSQDEVDDNDADDKSGVEKSLLLNIGGPNLPKINFKKDPTQNLMSSASISVSLPFNRVEWNTSWAPIYSSYRFAFGGNLAYRFNLTNGNYSVSMAFAETYRPAFVVGARQFDVVINRKVYFERLDVFATVGANRPLYLRVDDVETVGSQLTLVIRRVKGRQNPFLSALVIKPSGM